LYPWSLSLILITTQDTNTERGRGNQKERGGEAKGKRRTRTRRTRRRRRKKKKSERKMAERSIPAQVTRLPKHIIALWNDVLGISTSLPPLPALPGENELRIVFVGKRRPGGC